MKNELKDLATEIGRIQSEIHEAQRSQSAKMKELNSRREAIVAGWIDSGPHAVELETEVRGALREMSLGLQELTRWHSNYSDEIAKLMQSAYEAAKEPLEVQVRELRKVRDQCRLMLDKWIPNLSNLTSQYEIRVSKLSGIVGRN